MRKINSRPFIVAGAALATLVLAGCGESAVAEQNEASNATIDNQAEPLEEEEENSAATEALTLPEPAARLGESEAALLEEAAAISERIDAGDISEEPGERGGSQWLDNGAVVRTIDSRGRIAAYYRAGEQQPFLIQRGDRVYLFADGAPIGGINPRGRSIELNDKRREQAERLMRRAGRDGNGGGDGGADLDAP